MVFDRHVPVNCNFCNDIRGEANYLDPLWRPSKAAFSEFSPVTLGFERSKIVLLDRIRVAPAGTVPSKADEDEISC